MEGKRMQDITAADLREPPYFKVFKGRNGGAKEIAFDDLPILPDDYSDHKYGQREYQFLIEAEEKEFPLKLRFVDNRNYKWTFFMNNKTRCAFVIGACVNMEFEGKTKNLVRLPGECRNFELTVAYQPITKKQKQTCRSSRTSFKHGMRLEIRELIRPVLTLTRRFTY